MQLSKRLPYILTAVSSILYFLPFLRVLSHNGDEGTLIMGAVRVTEGQVPFRDFFEVMGPGTFYWLALFFKFLGTTWFATRICLLITTTAICLLLVYLSRRLRPGFEAIPVILFVAASYHDWDAISHHMSSNLFGLLAFAAFVRWMDKPRLLTLFLAGAGAGLTTWCMLPKGLLLFLSFLLLLWVLYRKNPLARSATAALAGGYLMFNAAGVAMFWAMGGLPDLIYANLIWPLTNYRGINVVPYGFEFKQLYWSGFTSSLIPLFSTAGGLVLSCMLSAPLILFIILPAVLLGCALYFGRDAFNRTTLPYWLAGAAFWLSEMHRKDVRHLVYGSPLLILLTFYLVRQVPNQWLQAAGKMVAACAVLLALLNPLVALSSQHAHHTRRGVVYDTFRENPVLDYMNATIATKEPIFIYPYSPLYYFLSAAENPTRYSILMYQINTDQQFRDVVQSLETTKVRHVIWDRHFPKMIKNSFPAYRIPPENALIVEPYLTEHYRVVGGSENGFQFLERIEPGTAVSALHKSLGGTKE